MERLGQVFMYWDLWIYVFAEIVSEEGLLGRKKLFSNSLPRTKNVKKQEQIPDPKSKKFDFQIPSESVRTEIIVTKRIFSEFFFCFVDVGYFYAAKIELLGSAWSSIVIEHTVYVATLHNVITSRINLKNQLQLK